MIISMSNDDLVTVITPAFNAERHLPRAVTSVLSQTHCNWEMLIVSDDGIDYRKLLHQQGLDDERIRFLHGPFYRSGPNVCRNLALREAQGQWITPLDADDRYFPERLRHLLGAAQQTGLALDNFLLLEENKQARHFSPSNPHYQEQYPQFGIEKFLATSAPLLFLFHRSLIQQGWNTDIDRGSDTIFNLRALERAETAGYVAHPLHEYHIHNESICHENGAEDRFDKAYQYTLERLRHDGLGFLSLKFKEQVIDYIEGKRRLNLEFRAAVLEGFKGNYQNYVQLRGDDSKEDLRVAV